MNNSSYPHEHFLELRINRNKTCRLICTGNDIKELIIGFLYNEGVIASVDDISSLHIMDHMSEVRVSLKEAIVLPKTVNPSGLGGEVLECGKLPEYRPIIRGYDLGYICLCAENMNAHAFSYQQTGGMHCSALFDDRNCLAQFEDIGRHNTLDKLCGYSLITGIDTTDTLLVTTGRISSDMVKKAARMGVSVISSYTTPTQQAVEIAEKANLTIVSYINKGGTVCTVRDRIES